MSSGRYLIRYTYPGTTGNGPIGPVYVQNAERVTLRPGSYAYTKDPEEAETFSGDEIDMLQPETTWPGAVAVPVEDAEPLG